MTSARNTVIRSPVGRPAPASFGRVLVVLGALALLGQAVFVGVRWWQERVPDYDVGQLADASLATPVDLTVVDPEATALAREQEGRRLPPLVRFDSRTGNRAAEQFLAEYDRRRALFAEGLRRHWPGLLTVDEVESQAFSDYVTAFHMAHPDFPLQDWLAQEWAGESAFNRLRNETASDIRQLLSQYVIDDELPREEQGYSEVILSAPAEAGGVRTAEQLEVRSSRLSTKALLSLGAAREKLRRMLSENGDDWAAYAGRFLTANVTFDGVLTGEARAAYAGNVEVKVEFRAGDPLVNAAQPVTRVQLAALDALREHYDALARNRGWSEWWPVLFGCALILLGGLVCASAGSTGQSLLPPPSAAMPRTLAVGSTEAEALRLGLLRHLAGWLKQAFVQRLIQQRNEAVATQAEVSQQVEKLNERLTRLDPEIRERVAQYERRIAQLERELDGANEVTRKLISTKISMARKELEIEKAKSNLVWN